MTKDELRERVGLRVRESEIAGEWWALYDFRSSKETRTVVGISEALCTPILADRFKAFQEHGGEFDLERERWRAAESLAFPEIRKHSGLA